MLKILQARAAQGAKEERWVRKLAASRHGPAGWIFHARMVVLAFRWRTSRGHRKASTHALVNQSTFSPTTKSEENIRPN